MLKLTEEAAASMSASDQKEIQFSWTDRIGQRRSGSIAVTLPGPLGASEATTPSCDLGLRKAHALTRYVDLVTEYAMADDTEEEDEEEDDYDSDGSNDAALESAAKKAKLDTSKCSAEVAKVIAGVGLDAVMAMTDAAAPINFPAGAPEKLIKKLTFVQSFKYLRFFLVNEMRASGDMSLESNNSNILQTIDQIISIETKEVATLFKAIEHSTVDEAMMAVANNDITGHIPRGFMCPVTLGMMKDPVLASDGHSYERSAIIEWLSKCNRSPVTNLELASNQIVPNFALRAAIEEYLSSSKAGK